MQLFSCKRKKKEKKKEKKREKNEKKKEKNVYTFLPVGLRMSSWMLLIAGPTGSGTAATNT